MSCRKVPQQETEKNCASIEITSSYPQTLNLGKFIYLPNLMHILQTEGLNSLFILDLLISSRTTKSILVWVVFFKCLLNSLIFLLISLKLSSSSEKRYGLMNCNKNEPKGTSNNPKSPLFCCFIRNIHFFFFLSDKWHQKKPVLKGYINIFKN